jgi:hypothetical protein
MTFSGIVTFMDLTCVGMFLGRKNETGQRVVDEMNEVVGEAILLSLGISAGGLR